jgi:hypothetical protein
LRKCLSVLAPGGCVIIIEFLAEAGQPESTFSWLFSVMIHGTLGGRRGVPVRRGRDVRAGLALVCSGSTFPKREEGQSPPAPVQYFFLRGLERESFPKRSVLGRVALSRTRERGKGQTKSYGSQGALRVLTVGCPLIVYTDLNGLFCKILVSNGVEPPAHFPYTGPMLGSQ